jgi:hypothetical protein
MNDKKKEIVVSGRVTDVSCPRIDGEQVTFAIDNAVPLWAEVRLPNRDGWVVGDRVSVSIVSAEGKPAREAE